MNIDDKDPLLQQLFAESQVELADEAFTAKVLSRTRYLRYRVAAAWIVAALSLAICAWILAIPYEFAELTAQALTTNLISLEEGWVGWFVSPVNNIGALLILLVKAARMVRKRLIGVSYAN